jgi:beta-glucosidase
MPLKELKGFNRLMIKAGEQHKVSIQIDKLKLRYWDETTSRFIYPTGEFVVMVGASSGDIRLRKKTSVH